MPSRCWASDDLIFTHISARLPGPDHHFLLNPYGLMFDEITASSLVLIDLQGHKLRESPFPVNPAGFTIHSSIHAARDDAQCVLHTHSRAGVAVSAPKAGVLPRSQPSTIVLGSLAHHDYEGIALNPDEQPCLQANLGRAKFLMLRNHGLLTVGNSVQEAFLNMYTFENTCRIQVDAQGAGAELKLIGRGPIAASRAAAKAVSVGQGLTPAWPTLPRKLDRGNPGYNS